MKTGDLQQAFGISNQTIRRWVAEFGDFLSDGAKGEGALQKVFNGDDYIVIATIKQLSADGNSMKAIKERLEAGYRLEDVSAATVGYQDGRTVPAAAVEQIINASELAIELEGVKAERDKLLTLLEQTQDRLDQLQTRMEAAEVKAREREGELQQEVRALTAQMSELQRALGKAEGELELRREQEGKKRGWFG